MKDFIDVVWTLKEKDGVSDWELFAITTWMIWNNRNMFKHEGRCKDLKRIAMEAREYVKDVADESLPLAMVQPLLAQNGALLDMGGTKLMLMGLCSQV